MPEHRGVGRLLKDRNPRVHWVHLGARARVQPPVDRLVGVPLHEGRRVEHLDARVLLEAEVVDAPRLGHGLGEGHLGLASAPSASRISPTAEQSKKSRAQNGALPRRASRSGDPRRGAAIRVDARRGAAAILDTEHHINFRVGPEVQVEVGPGRGVVRGLIFRGTHRQQHVRGLGWRQLIERVVL